MIEISFNGTDERVIAALRTRGARLREGLTRTLDELMLELQKRVQRKLSGEVLQTRRGGGGLLGSVHKLATEEHFGSLFGRVTAAGGPFWWGRVHEEGGKKTYPILPGIVTGKSDKKALAFFGEGAAGLSFGRTAMTRLRFASGKSRGSLRPKMYSEFKAAGGIVVKAVMHPPLPKRAFMAPALEEMRAEIIRRVYETAARAIR